MLTKGCIAAYKSGVVDFPEPPIVQVLSIKSLQKGHYKLQISDGILYTIALTGNPQAGLFSSNEVKPLTVIKIVSAVLHEVQQKLFLFILKMDVVDNTVTAIIGHPEGADVNSTNNPIISTTGEKNNGFQQQQQQQQQQQVKSEPQQSFPQQKPSLGNANKNSLVSQRQQQQQQNDYGTLRKNEISTINSNSSNNMGYNPQPIHTLNPYVQNWCIKARVTKKGDIRHWSKPSNNNNNNNNGGGTKGKLFSVDLVDESDSEIRATMFNGAVDKLFDMFQEGKVYIISKGSLRPSNKSFSSIKNTQELMLDESSTVIPVDDDRNIPIFHYALTPISELGNVEDNAVIDIIGMVIEVKDIHEFVSKTSQKNLKKRSVILCDFKQQQESASERYQVELTFWGDLAEKVSLDVPSVALFKGVKKGSYLGGVNLNSLNSTVILSDPQIPEALRLKELYARSGSDPSSAADVKMLSVTTGKGVFGVGGGDPLAEPLSTLAAITEKGLGTHGQTDFIQVVAHLMFVKKEGNLWYEACTGEKCSKKVVLDSGSNKYRCDHCGTVSDKCVYRYIISAMFSDHTGQRWVSGFNEAGDVIFGRTAEEMTELRNNSPEAFEKTLTDACFKTYILKLRLKEEDLKSSNSTFGDHNNKFLKASIIKISPMNWSLGSKMLLKELEQQ